MQQATLYHGSNEFFGNFEFGQAKNGTDQGFGIYLTPSLERAKQYSSTNGYIYEVDSHKLTDMKQLNPQDVTLTNEDVTELVTTLAKAQQEDEGYAYVLADFGYEIEEDWSEEHDIISSEVATTLLENNENDVDIINELNNTINNPKIIGQTLTKLNYGYTTDTRVSDTQPDFIVFDPANISITKQTPAIDKEVPFSKELISSVYDSFDRGNNFDSDLTFHEEVDDFEVSLIVDNGTGEAITIEPAFEGESKFKKGMPTTERRLAADLQFALQAIESEPAQLLAEKFGQTYHTGKFNIWFDKGMPEIQL